MCDQNSFELDWIEEMSQGNAIWIAGSDIDQEDVFVVQGICTSGYAPYTYLNCCKNIFFFMKSPLNIIIITGTILTYSKWGTGQPDDSEHNENCLIHQPGNGFSDESCSSLHSRVCQMQEPLSCKTSGGSSLCYTDTSR